MKPQESVTHKLGCNHHQVRRPGLVLEYSLVGYQIRKQEDGLKIQGWRGLCILKDQHSVRTEIELLVLTVSGVSKNNLTYIIRDIFWSVVRLPKRLPVSP